MFDIWGFLIQTLTVSGIAVLLLIIKAIFKDKLPPKWQFAVWGILGIVMLLPASTNGRYTLIPWQMIVEILKVRLGDGSFTRILFPFPLVTSIPRTFAQWIFVGYVLGVIVHAAKYISAYVRIRLVLQNGTNASAELTERICRIAATRKVKVGRIVTVPELSSAFVCGVFRPILAVPADEEIDDKVILHEVLHMKYKDTFWNIVICLLRCIHWCNPLIGYCANRAINEMEVRCDQLVLEQLEGEERRDYGRILLSMANDCFANTPGSTCINNGGKNISDRIETIAQFKKYPAGMGLVSVCIYILMALSLVTNVRAMKVYEPDWTSATLGLASARCVPCTTLAGAFDTYAKAIIGQNGAYRAMCAPEPMQEELIKEMVNNEANGIRPCWNCGLVEEMRFASEYFIYNLQPCGKDTYEGLLVIVSPFMWGAQPGLELENYLTIQTLRAEKEGGRWCIVAVDGLRTVKTMTQELMWGCPDLPSIVYSDTVSDIRFDVNVQTVYSFDIVPKENQFVFSGNAYFDTMINPAAEFSTCYRTQSEVVTHLGTEQERDRMEGIGVSVVPVYAGETRPMALTPADEYDLSSGTVRGESLLSRRLQKGWGPSAVLGRGGGGDFNPNSDAVFPEYYVTDLYINGEFAAQLDLHLQKGERE